MNNWTKILSIAAIAISLLALVSVSQNRGGTSTQSAMQRVRDTGVLRCGFFVEPPFTERDKITGKPVGVIPDMMEQIAKYAEIKVDFTTEVSLATMIEDLDLGKIDMICGSTGYNPIRSKRALFVDSFGYGALYAVVRQDETRIAPDLSNLETSGAAVVSMDGEVGTLTAKSRFPKATYVSVPQMSGADALMLGVVDRKMDVAFVAPQVFNSYNENNPGKLKILSREYPLATFPAGFMVRAGERDLADFVSDSIEFLQSIGALDVIFDTYDPKHELFLRPAKLYRTER